MSAYHAKSLFAFRQMNKKIWGNVQFARKYFEKTNMNTRELMQRVWVRLQVEGIDLDTGVILAEGYSCS